MATTTVKSLPRTEAPRLTGVTGNTNMLGDVPWGPAAPELATTFEEWKELNGDQWLGMTELQKLNYLRAFIYFNLGGQYLSTTRVLELDSQGSPTGKKSTLDLSSGTVSATNAEIISGVGPYTLVSDTTIQFIIDAGASTFTANVGPLQITPDIVFVTSVAAGEFQNYSVIDVDGTIGDVAVDVGQFAVTMSRSDLETTFNAAMVTASHVSTLTDGSGGGDVVLNVDDPSVAFTFRSLTTSSLLASSLPVGMGRCAQYDTGASVYDIAAGAEAAVTIIWQYNTLGFNQLLSIDCIEGSGVADLDAMTPAELSALLTTAVSSIAGLTILTDADDIRIVVDAQVTGVTPSVSREVHANAIVNTAFTAETITAGQVSLTGTQVRNGSRTAVQVQSELELALGMGSLATLSSANNRITLRRVASGATKDLRVDGTARVALGFGEFTVAGTDAISPQVIWRADGKYVGAYGNRIALKVVAGTSATKRNIEIYVHSKLRQTLTDVEDTTISLEDKSDDQNLIILTAVNAGVPEIDGASVSMASGTDRLAPASALGPASYTGNKELGTGVHQANALSIDDQPDMLVSSDFYSSSDLASNAGLVNTGLANFVDDSDTKERMMYIPSFEPTQDYRRTVEIADANAAFIASDNVAITHGGFKILNPHRDVASAFGGARLINLDGAIIHAAIISRGDGNALSGGIHRAAAGVQRGGRGVVAGNVVSIYRADDAVKADTANPSTRRVLDAKNINYFVEEGQILMESARIFSTTGNYSKIPNRRGHSSMFRAMEKALQSLESREIIDTVVVDEGEDLIVEILETNMKIGAFSSLSASEAFRVESGPDVNPPDALRRGKIAYRVFTAPVGVVEEVETLVSNKD